MAMGRRLGIHKAAAKGHTRLITTCLRDDPTVDRDAQDPAGKTPLYIASAKGYSSVVKVLLEAGADVNCRCGPFQITALFAACINQRYNVLRDLVKAGGNLNLSGVDGKTLLHVTVNARRSKDLAELVALGADLNVRDKHGFTPLMESTHLSTPGAIYAQILVDGGADLAATGPTGQTALLMAAGEGNHAVVRVLLAAGANTSDRETQGWTPLIIAAQHGHVEVVRELLEAGADISAVTDSGLTALVISCKVGHEEVVRELCEAGADVNKMTVLVGMGPSMGECTPLMAAVHGGHEGVVRELVKAGADVNKGPQDHKPLFVAGFEGHVKVVRQLLRLGASPLVKPKGSVLNSAAVHCKLKVAQVLLQEGCLEDDPEAPYVRPISMIGCAVADRNIWQEKCMRMLLLRGPAFRARSWLWVADAHSAAAATTASNHESVSCGARDKGKDAVDSRRKRLPVALQYLRHRPHKTGSHNLTNVLCRYVERKEKGGAGEDASAGTSYPHLGV